MECQPLAMSQDLNFNKPQIFKSKTNLNFKPQVSNFRKSQMFKLQTNLSFKPQVSNFNKSQIFKSQINQFQISDLKF